jgi:hypothetical protein
MGGSAFARPVVSRVYSTQSVLNHKNCVCTENPFCSAWLPEARMLLFCMLMLAILRACTGLACPKGSFGWFRCCTRQPSKGEGQRSACHPSDNWHCRQPWLLNSGKRVGTGCSAGGKQAMLPCYCIQQHEHVLHWRCLLPPGAMLVVLECCWTCMHLTVIVVYLCCVCS